MYAYHPYFVATIGTKLNRKHRGANKNEDINDGKSARFIYIRARTYTPTKTKRKP